MTINSQVTSISLALIHQVLLISLDIMTTDNRGFFIPILITIINSQVTQNTSHNDITIGYRMAKKGLKEKEVVR
jgi:hypothetical protein